MRNISPALLQAFKDGNRATLMRLQTKDGSVFGFTDNDMSLIVEGITYKPAPGMTQPTLTATVNDQVSNQEFTSAWVDAPEEDLASGKFDNAIVEIAYCDPTNVGLGRFIFDKGTIGVVQWTADGFRADVQSHMRQLARNINFVFTAGCRHQLFSQFGPSTIGACTVNATSYTFTGSVASITLAKLSFTASGLAQPSGMCANGVLKWTTGNNAGLSYPVKSQNGSAIELFVPTMAVIQAGDNFQVTAGCDKTIATCKSKFNNVINFGGFPHIQVEIQYR